MKTREELIDEAVRKGFSMGRHPDLVRPAMEYALRGLLWSNDIRDIRSAFQPRDSQGRFMKRNG